MLGAETDLRARDRVPVRIGHGRRSLMGVRPNDSVAVRSGEGRCSLGAQRGSPSDKGHILHGADPIRAQHRLDRVAAGDRRREGRGRDALCVGRGRSGNQRHAHGQDHSGCLAVRGRVLFVPDGERGGKRLLTVGHDGRIGSDDPRGVRRARGTPHKLSDHGGCTDGRPTERCHHREGPGGRRGQRRAPHPVVPCRTARSIQDRTIHDNFHGRSRDRIAEGIANRGGHPVLGLPVGLHRAIRNRYRRGAVDAHRRGSRTKAHGPRATGDLRPAERGCNGERPCARGAEGHAGGPVRGGGHGRRPRHFQLGVELDGRGHRVVERIASHDRRGVLLAARDFRPRAQRQLRVRRCRGTGDEVQRRGAARNHRQPAGTEEPKLRLTGQRELPGARRGDRRLIDSRGGGLGDGRERRPLGRIQPERDRRCEPGHGMISLIVQRDRHSVSVGPISVAGARAHREQRGRSGRHPGGERDLRLCAQGLAVHRSGDGARSRSAGRQHRGKRPVTVRCHLAEFTQCRLKRHRVARLHDGIAQSVQEGHRDRCGARAIGHQLCRGRLDRGPIETRVGSDGDQRARPARGRVLGVAGRHVDASRCELRDRHLVGTGCDRSKRQCHLAGGSRRDRSNAPAPTIRTHGAVPRSADVLKPLGQLQFGNRVCFISGTGV